MNEKEMIARRVAKELKDGDRVNLGIGLPTLVAHYLAPSVHVFFHSENGIMGHDPSIAHRFEDRSALQLAYHFDTTSRSRRDRARGDPAHHRGAHP